MNVANCETDRHFPFQVLCWCTSVCIMFWACQQYCVREHKYLPLCGSLPSLITNAYSFLVIKSVNKKLAKSEIYQNSLVFKKKYLTSTFFETLIFLSINVIKTWDPWAVMSSHELNILKFDPIYSFVILL